MELRNIYSLKNPKNIVDANDLDTPTNHHFVHLLSSSSSSAVFDGFTSIFMNTAILQREVKYCQPKEDNESQKQWISYSSKLTPKVEKIAETRLYGHLFVGKYEIDQSFFLDLNTLDVLIPNSSQLNDFAQSKAQKKFRYIGSGYFYSEKTPGSNKIFSDLAETNSNENQGQLINQILGQCNPGDIYMRYLIFHPSCLCVIGKRYNALIKPMRGRLGPIIRYECAIPDKIYSLHYDRLVLASICIQFICFIKRCDHLLANLLLLDVVMTSSMGYIFENFFISHEWGSDLKYVILITFLSIYIVIRFPKSQAQIK